jgi:formiminotetrahydrofolate cyclodeaminase
MDEGEPEGGGALAARTLEQAAALIADAAHRAEPDWPGAAGAAAQAQALGRRAALLRAQNAVAFAAARDALGGALASEDAATRDHLLGDALKRAADAPLAIAQAGADAATLGAHVAAHAPGFAAADAMAAAALAAGAARAAAHLVAINLVTRDDDLRLRAAREAVARAERAVHDGG